MTKVLLIEDHTLVRESLVKLIQNEPGFEVVGQTGRGDAVLELVEQRDPDIVVLDVDLGAHDGLEIGTTLRRRHPHVKIIFLTMHDADSYLRRALSLGADGFVPKSSSTDELVQALRTVSSGGSYLSPSVTRRAIDLAAGRSEGPVASLTDRELEILMLLADGARPGDIADRLFISVKTVKNHLTSIYSKLGVQSGAQAVAEAYRLGIVTSGGPSAT